MKKPLLLFVTIFLLYTANSQQLTAVSVNLYTYLPDAGNERSLRDGVAVFFNDHSDTVDLFDLKKLANPLENIAILMDNILLAGEHRTTFDTIPITMWNLKQRDYELEIFTRNISNAYLENVNTHARLAIPAADTLRYRFTNLAEDTPLDSSVTFWLIFGNAPPVVRHCGYHPHHNNHKTIKLYPNPLVGSYVNLEMNNLHAGRYKVTILGSAHSTSYKFIHENDRPERINTTGLAKGKYYFIIEDEEGWKEARQIEVD